jgi:RNA polymerase sigma factor (sigma-70 family)
MTIPRQRSYDVIAIDALARRVVAATRAAEAAGATPDEARRGAEVRALRAEFAELSRPFVHAAARWFDRFERLDVDERNQEGFIGLFLALDKFECDRGVKFNTFATWWVRNQVLRAIAAVLAPVPLSPDTAWKLVQYTQTEQALVVQLGRPPTPTQLLAALQAQDAARVPPPFLPWTAHRFANAQRAAALQFCKGDALLGCAGGGDDVVEGASILEQRALIHDALRALSPRSRRVVCLHYGLTEDGPAAGDDEASPLTYEVIGALCQPPVSRERVRQIIQAALKKLERWLDAQPRDRADLAEPQVEPRPTRSSEQPHDQAAEALPRRRLCTRAAASRAAARREADREHQVLGRCGG